MCRFVAVCKEEYSTDSFLNKQILLKLPIHRRQSVYPYVEAFRPHATDKCSFYVPSHIADSSNNSVI